MFYSLIYLVKSQCYPQCSNTEECQDYQCICKVGYYRNSARTCGKYDRPSFFLLSIRVEQGWVQD